MAKEQYEAGGALLANISLDDLQGFNLTEEATDSYRAYLKKLENHTDKIRLNLSGRP